MDFPVLPPLRIGSFPSAATTIESQHILPVQSIETQLQQQQQQSRPVNKTQHAIDGMFPSPFRSFSDFHLETPLPPIQEMLVLPTKILTIFIFFSVRVSFFGSFEQGVGKSRTDRESTIGTVYL